MNEVKRSDFIDTECNEVSGNKIHEVKRSGNIHVRILNEVTRSEDSNDTEWNEVSSIIHVVILLPLSLPIRYNTEWNEDYNYTERSEVYIGPRIMTCLKTTNKRQ